MKNVYGTVACLVSILFLFVSYVRCSSEAEMPNDEEKQIFYDAIQVGNLEAVRRCVEANPVYLSCGRTTSDFFAAYHGQAAIYMYLFDKLFEHYFKGHRRTVEHIEGQSIAAEGHSFFDRYQYHRSGKTALHFAVHGGFIELAKLLLAQGASVNTPTLILEKRRPIELALERDNYDMVKLLVKAGADICYEPLPVEITLLQRPTAQRRGDIAQYLVRHGARILDCDDAAMRVSFFNPNVAREQEVISRELQKSPYGALLPTVLNQLILGFLSPFLRLPDRETWGKNGGCDDWVWQYRRMFVCQLGRVARSFDDADEVVG